MVRHRRIAWVLVGTATATAGCGQVLGLGAYVQAEGGPTDSSSFGTSDSTLGDGPSTLLTDAPPDTSNDLASDAGFVAVADSSGGADSPVDVVDAPLGSTTDSADGTTLSDTSVAEAQPPDSAADASLDSSPTDAAMDAGFTCPTECNGGCGNGGACVITITTPTAAPINCPPGIACQVRCLGTQVCLDTINCATGQACKVTCEGFEACSNNAINQGSATSLCVDCIGPMGGGGGGSRGCNSVSCTGATCSLRCPNGCFGSCGNCARVFTCP